MGRVYYNEIDKYCAEWLRNLVAAGEIAPGDVDDRDIRDVSPADLAGYDQCHFFAGIGGWSLALRLAGWPDDRPCWTGSCPCQPFSSAGKGEAFGDERHLWPAWLPLIRECRPSTILGEQVAAAIGWGWLDLVLSDLEGEGYACGAAVLPACGVGAPHIRQRLWFVADDIGQGCGGTDRPRGSRLRDATERHGGHGDVADAEGGGRGEQRHEARSGRGGHADGGVVPHGLADTQRDGGPRYLYDYAAERRQDARDDPRHGGDPVGEYSGLADPEHDGRGADLARRQSQGREAHGWPGSGNVADADGGNPSPEWLQRGGEHGCEPQDGRIESLADPAGDGTGGAAAPEQGGDQPQDGIPRADGRNGELADADRESQQRGHGGSGPQGNDPRPVGPHPGGGGTHDELADADASRRGTGRPGEAGNGRDATRLEPTGLCPDDVLGDAERAGLQERGPQGGGGGQAPSPPARQAVERAGFWDDLIWLPCTDGKQRPTRPGLFPLAHGVPTRMAKLRAAGNAIVPQVAARFVQAVMDGPVDGPSGTLDEFLEK